MPTNWLIIIAIGACAGFASGFFGIGGGIILVPCLVYFCKFSQHEAVATSLAIMLPPVTFFAVWEYYKKGWVDIKTFCNALASHKGGVSLTEEDIAQIIAGSEKKRFEMSNGKIRATYGHSIESRIEFTPSVPPPVLYHGTSNKALDSIRKDGLLPMNRQYVHL